MRSEREKGGGHALGDSKGRSPWRAFGDFPRVGKVTRGGGAERPHKGRSAEDGAQPLLASGQQGPKAPAKGPASPRGRGETLTLSPHKRGRGETLTLSPHKQSARKKFL